MALVDSLLTAMVRADGDALVMHVGERPIVVSGSKTIDLSTHGMNLSAMVGMLGQLLSGDALALLKDLGAVEHLLPSRGSDRFSVVAARSGDDIWIEIRRRRVKAPSAATEPIAEEPGPASASDLAAEAPQAVTDTRGSVNSDEAQRGETPAVSTALVDAEPAETAPVETALVETAPVETGPVETEPVLAQAQSPATEPVEASSAAAEPQALSRAPERDAVAEPEPGPAALAVDAESERVAATEPPGNVEVPASAALDEPSPPTVAAREAGAPDEAETLSAQPGSNAEVVKPADDVMSAMPELITSADTATLPEPVDTEPTLQPEQVEPPAAPVQVEAQAEEEPSVEADVPASSADPEPVAPTVEEAPAMPVLASAGASAYPDSLVTPVVPMDPSRHAGLPAGGPPPRLTPPSVPAVTAVTGTESSAGVPDAPVTRTVRIEVPARAIASSRTGIDRLLRAADAAGASELFLISQARPYVRVGGNVRPLQEEAALPSGDIETLIADVTPEPWRDAVRRGDPAEWLIELAEVGRVRCSTFRDHRGPGANFHFAFLRAATADDLQLSADARLLATEPDGLVLVAGGAGSDAQSIVAAFVDILNHQRADYIISLEPQVRVAHVSRESLVSQREVGHDAARALVAAKAALREEPDVLVIDGVSTGDMAQLVIDAASQDRLVIVSIDAPSAPAAVQRLVDLVPADQRQAARAALARCFRGAVAQLLLRRSTGGRIAARELLSGTRGVARILADGDLARLPESLEASGAPGMAPLTDAIVEYVRAGVVDVREAARKAPDLDALMTRLKDAGVDVRAIERLA